MQSRTGLSGRWGSRAARLGVSPSVVAIVVAAIALLLATMAIGPVEPTSESVVMAPWRW
jgi:hypothetical protein